MYPNDPQNTQPITTDYLNEIAPIQNNKGDFTGKKRLIIIGLIIATLLSFILLTISVVLSGSDKKVEILAARLNSTIDIADEADSNLKSSKLRADNSNLKLFLTNTIRDIEPILASDNIDIDKLSESAVTAESNESIMATLEDARLNAVYDQTYAREMAYKLETILSLMKQIYSSTKDEDLRELLENTYTNLEPTQESFAAFNSTNN